MGSLNILCYTHTHTHTHTHARTHTHFLPHQLTDDNVLSAQRGGCSPGGKRAGELLGVQGEPAVHLLCARSLWHLCGAGQVLAFEKQRQSGDHVGTTYPVATRVWVGVYFCARTQPGERGCSVSLRGCLKSLYEVLFPGRARPVVTAALGGVSWVSGHLMRPP